MAIKNSNAVEGSNKLKGIIINNKKAPEAFKNQKKKSDVKVTILSS